jgi:hypothetical protein
VPARDPQQRFLFSGREVMLYEEVAMVKQSADLVLQSLPFPCSPLVTWPSSARRWQVVAEEKKVG